MEMIFSRSKLLNPLLFLFFLEAWEPLLQFYETHKEEEHPEQWSRGYTYVNTWESPSYVQKQ